VTISPAARRQHGTLHARILRQERLDTKKTAKTAAKRAMGTAHNAFPRSLLSPGCVTVPGGTIRCKGQPSV